MFVRLLAAIVVLLVFVNSGFAAEPASGDPHAAEHAHHQTLRGEPQPDNPIAVDPLLLVWTLILFLALLVLANSVAWQPILELFKEREKRIADIVTEAENLKAEARLLREETDRELATAHDEVRRLIDKVRAEAGKESEALLADAKAQAVKDREQAIAEIESAKRDALAEVDRTSVELAAKMASKFVDKRIDPELVRRHMEN